MRYTKTFLRHQVDVINRMLGHDANTVTTDTPASVHLYMAYGGYGVHFISAYGRGRDSLLPCVSARECARFLAGMVAGMDCHEIASRVSGRS